MDGVDGVLLEFLPSLCHPLRDLAVRLDILDAFVRFGALRPHPPGVQPGERPDEGEDGRERVIGRGGIHWWMWGATVFKGNWALNL